MKKLLFSLCFVLPFCLFSIIPWSVVYKRTYTIHERQLHTYENTIFFLKESITPFTQLIISWNAFMPDLGGFTFYVRIHVVGKPESAWEPWHKALTWSQESQRSFFNKSHNENYNHVRLELHDALFADGFEIRVEAHEQGNLQKLYGLFICASDYKEFKPELPYKATVGLATVLIEGVQKKSQKLVDHPRINAICSPTTLSMLLESLTGEPVDPLETARNVYDSGLDVFGSWPFNVAYAFEKCQGRYFFYTARLSHFAQLHRMLSYGVPVAVSIRGSIKGGRKEYKNGHFVLVVGFDSAQKKVLCYDPAFESLDNVGVWYALEDFLVAWERSYRIAYLAHSA